jgi:mono/diheme cytochrome c family protein
MSVQKACFLWMLLGGTVLLAQQTPWKAPTESSLTKIPVRYVYNEARARNLFQAQCSMCHGKSGKGDGPLSIAYKVADLATPLVQAQTNGALLWKIKQGRTPMPAFGHSLREEELWDMVCLIRTFDSESSNHTFPPDSLTKNTQN